MARALRTASSTLSAVSTTKPRDLHGTGQTLQERFVVVDDQQRHVVSNIPVSSGIGCIPFPNKCIFHALADIYCRTAAISNRLVAVSRLFFGRRTPIERSAARRPDYAPWPRRSCCGRSRRPVARAASWR